MNDTISIETNISDNLPYTFCEQTGKEIRDISGEIPFDIPDSWEWCRCSTLGVIIRGNGIKRTEIIENGIPCVRYGELYTTYDTSFTKTISFISQELFDKCKKISYGDVIFTLTGENKPDIAKTVAYLGDSPVAVGGDLAYWTYHGMNPLYLAYFMSSPYAIEQKINLATGNIIVHISGDKVGSILIPVPPIEEQKRIVSKIEELLPYIEEYDKAETELSALNETFPEVLKKSILQEAVQGKLVPQDPNDEPASVLLERIKAEKQRLIKEGKIKKDKQKPPAITSAKIPYTIPESWVWCRLGFISTYNQAKQKINAKNADKSIWLLDLEDIEKGGRLLVKKTVGDKKAIGDKTLFNKGDILYSKLRPYLLKILIASGNGICTPEIVPFTVYSDISAEYIVNFLKSPYVDGFINGETYGIKMPRAGTETMINLPVPLPPVEEQKRIVRKIDEIMQIINKL